MNANRKERKEDIYTEEASHLSRVKGFLSDEDKTFVETKEELSKLAYNYSELLDQVMLITRISDRLQRKLDQTNEKLNEVNQEIREKNIQLEKTINDLAEAKIGRRATTFVFIVALILFVITEVFIEPWVGTFYNDFYVTLGLKAIIALSIKPLESLVEETLVKKARAKTLKAASLRQDSV